jgi:hypothetical protein
MKIFATVHVAGKVENGLQCCVRCGHVLIDYRGKNPMALIGGDLGLSYWESGKLIGATGGASYLLPDRALDPDEAHCATARPQ